MLELFKKEYNVLFGFCTRRVTNGTRLRLHCPFVRPPVRDSASHLAGFYVSLFKKSVIVVGEFNKIFSNQLRSTVKPT